MRSLLLAMAVLALSADAVGAEPPSSDRQQELLNLLKHDCGSCHGLTFRGGLGPALLAEAIADKDDAVLLHTILNGRKGTAMPPWRDFLSESEAQWIINYLRRYQNVD